MGNDDSGLTQIWKRGNGYYGRNDSFDFEAKDKAELEAKLKRWGYELQAGSLEESEFSPIGYARKIKSGKISIEKAREESGIPYHELSDLVKKLDEAKEEDAVDTITMDVPLFIRVLEYAREDAQADMDLHDLAEKAIAATKQQGLLQMDDYDMLVGEKESLNEDLTSALTALIISIIAIPALPITGALLMGLIDYLFNDLPDQRAEAKSLRSYKGPDKQEKVLALAKEIESKLSPGKKRYLKTLVDRIGASKLEDKAKEYRELDRYVQRQKLDENLATDIESALEDLPVPTDMNEETLTEAYVPENIKEFAKRKGVSRLVNTVAGWAEKVGARITGGTAIGKNYNTLILDMGYQTADIRIDCDDEAVELYDEPVYSFADFKRVFMEEEARKQEEHDEETLSREQGLEEEEKGYSKFLVSKDNPKGETKGLTPDVMNKILMRVIQDIEESRPGLWDNIRAKQERGEKPSRKGSKAYKTAVKAGKEINKAKK